MDDLISEALREMFRQGLATITPTGEIILTAKGQKKAKAQRGR